MRVLIAPDCYGDSLTAVEAAQSIAAGWCRARPSDDLVLAPQSDGGPGFVGVLAGRLGEVRHTRVSGPLTDQVDADWVDDRATSTAYIECAQACGLAQLPGPPTPDTAVAAHSRGVGELIGAALDAGAQTIVVGLGGSCCTDGGRGMIEALGGPTQARAKLAGVELVAATDVEHPLLGPMGAARIFGPQKGADPDVVEILEQRMTGWAAKLDELAGHTVSPVPGAGAAGGLGAALLALGARRESGAAVIAEHTGLAEDIAAADVIITGEGRFDDQSLHGKVVSALADGARAHGIPVIVLAGQVSLGPATLAEAGITAAYAISDYAGSVQVAIDDAAAQLTGLAGRTAAGLVG
ncbi:glycerate kinase [Mycolicibacterium sp. P1-5]|uniref:glycerate kinase family protein n=1 Tax=Mycolicibacterium sp. P1-5 TaxID=2024617 RepID=UPI0011EC993D|nr:glycerate kinase [Mycolicibacterium sp. P1-5]KAA0109608.1 glycerate kinase [Mycolicibacterium sp. P1-5]